ncbi:MAG: hypothetical protein BJ554DRAFT_7570 [Olpidium bornovanus]|uniref:Uncharacterized protein n=1 Tax=Olpidium bornovanus TaxID=278681 RepID=A0A8H7ZW08_9FUNG|nr:MAG: hypothetical protein BJ554DRAFT_7570 [Olpidium bornovanus]
MLFNLRKANFRGEDGFWQRLEKNISFPEHAVPEVHRGPGRRRRGSEQDCPHPAVWIVDALTSTPATRLWVTASSAASECSSFCRHPLPHVRQFLLCLCAPVLSSAPAPSSSPFPASLSPVLVLCSPSPSSSLPRSSLPLSAALPPTSPPPVPSATDVATAVRMRRAASPDECAVAFRSANSLCDVHRSTGRERLNKDVWRFALSQHCINNENTTLFDESKTVLVVQIQRINDEGSHGFLPKQEPIETLLSDEEQNKHPSAFDSHADWVSAPQHSYAVVKIEHCTVVRNYWQVLAATVMKGQGHPVIKRKRVA